MEFYQITRRKWLLGLACLWLAGGWADGEEKSAGVGEYQVKAAFLYNFTQFTDWPASAFASTNAPIVIGIVGEDPFGKTMDEVVSGEVVRGRLLVLKRLGADEDLRGCHVLFISRSAKERLPAMLSQLKGSPVLTVSDLNGFGQQGGMVNLLLVNKTVKMEINQAAAEEAGLQISAKLLKLARIVKP
ncbi:MAG: YfiR family protein [Pedosphaera sp.]|nr:YfiR family protein [Pedosphaera sp.]